MHRPEHKRGPRRRFVISCQQFSVTIANGALTGTATVNYVDEARSFIIFGGHRGGSTLTARDVASVALTKYDTITATRPGSTGAMTVVGTLVHCSARLVRSVQQGTITPAAATTGTATINAVDTSRSAVFALGVQSSQGGSLINQTLGQMVLTNSTTVTLSAGAATAMTFGFVVVEFEPDAVTAAHEATLSATNTNTSDAVTLAATIDTNRAALAYGGLIASVNGMGNVMVCAAITDGVTVTDTRVGAANTVHGVAGRVIAFAPEAVRRIHRGSITITAGTIGTATIPVVDPARAWCAYLGNDCAAAATPDTAFADVVLTDATTVTANLGVAGTVNVSFEVVELN